MYVLWHKNMDQCMEYCSICKYEVTVAYEFSNHSSPRFVHIFGIYWLLMKKKKFTKVAPPRNRDYLCKIGFCLGYAAYIGHLVAHTLPAGPEMGCYSSYPVIQKMQSHEPLHLHWGSTSPRGEDLFLRKTFFPGEGSLTTRGKSG